MKSFYINPATNDLELDGHNEIKTVEGDEELLQSVRIILTTNLKEWFLNPQHGFDRFAVLGKRVERDRVFDALYQAILQDERINRINDVKMDIDREKRKIKVDFSFTKKEDGETIEGSASL